MLKTPHLWFSSSSSSSLLHLDHPHIRPAFPPLFTFSLPPLFTFNSVFLLLLIPSLSLLEFHIILHNTAQNIIGNWWWCWIWWYRVSILLIHPYLHFPHPPPCSIPFSINISSLKHCCAGQVACHITFSRRQFPGTSRWLDPSTKKYAEQFIRNLIFFMSKYCRLLINKYKSKREEIFSACLLVQLLGALSTLSSFEGQVLR